mmetsp:Transcript_32859/g.84189  ORF Transcript_32859/g.84189 Transcript_32859/m.84189 type:complete len:200 (-) Transcript_32859:2455-3054(-)
MVRLGLARRGGLNGGSQGVDQVPVVHLQVRRRVGDDIRHVGLSGVLVVGAESVQPERHAVHGLYEVPKELEIGHSLAPLPGDADAEELRGLNPPGVGGEVRLGAPPRDDHLLEDAEEGGVVVCLATHCVQRGEEEDDTGREGRLEEGRADGRVINLVDLVDVEGLAVVVPLFGGALVAHKRDIGVADELAHNLDVAVVA